MSLNFRYFPSISILDKLWYLPAVIRASYHIKIFGALRGKDNIAAYLLCVELAVVAFFDLQLGGNVITRQFHLKDIIDVNVIGIGGAVGNGDGTGFIAFTCRLVFFLFAAGE